MVGKGRFDSILVRLDNKIPGITVNPIVGDTLIGRSRYSGYLIWRSGLDLPKLCQHYDYDFLILKLYLSSDLPQQYQYPHLHLYLQKQYLEDNITAIVWQIQPTSPYQISTIPTPTN